MLDERFWAKVDRTSECWVWTGARHEGYGVIGSHRFGTRLAHRVSYMDAKGDVPDGLVIDHLCRNRACVNPDHLEVVTHGENLRRGEGWSGRNHRKTHCSQGHPFNEVNTAHENSPHRKRRCKTCKAIVQARWYENSKRRKT